MKISRLLNKKIFSIILILFSCFIAHAEDQPVDIWNIEKKKIEDIKKKNETNINGQSVISSSNETDIYNMQSEKQKNSIELNKIIKSMKIKFMDCMTQKILI